MDAGALKERITFLKRPAQVGTVVDKNPVWIDDKTVWAKVETEKAEQFYAGRDMVECVYRATIRKKKDIPELSTVRWRGKVLQLFGVDQTDIAATIFRMRGVS
jgi:SPP1 family predicted phage head-tail adaptor